MGDRRRGRQATTFGAGSGRRRGGSPSARGTALGNRTTGALLQNPAVPSQVVTGAVAVQRRNQLPTAQLDQDSIFETLAHEMSYEDGLTPERLSRIHALGYRPMDLRQGPQGFQCMGFVDSGSSGTNKPPVLAFRGTSEFEDLLADLHGQGVGFGQLEGSFGIIQQYLDDLGGRAVVVGHSLGGALAQLAAARFPTHVRQIVSFNAPGIAADIADDLRNYNAQADDEHRIGSTHYRAEGDIVDDAGEAHTDGQVVEVGNDSARNGTDSIAAHTRYVLWDLQHIRREQGEEAYQRARVRVSQTRRGHRPVELIRQAIRRLLLATVRLVNGLEPEVLFDRRRAAALVRDGVLIRSEVETIRRLMPTVPPAEREAMVTALRGLRDAIRDAVRSAAGEVVSGEDADLTADLVADRVFHSILDALNLPAS